MRADQHLRRAGFVSAGALAVVLGGAVPTVPGLQEPANAAAGDQCQHDGGLLTGVTGAVCETVDGTTDAVTGTVDGATGGVSDAADSAASAVNGTVAEVEGAGPVNSDSSGSDAAGSGSVRSPGSENPESDGSVPTEESEEDSDGAAQAGSAEGDSAPYAGGYLEATGPLLPTGLGTGSLATSARSDSLAGLLAPGRFGTAPVRLPKVAPSTLELTRQAQGQSHSPSRLNLRATQRLEPVGEREPLNGSSPWPAVAMIIAIAAAGSVSAGHVALAQQRLRQRRSR